MDEEMMELKAQNSNDKELIDCLCPDEKCRFLEWFIELNRLYSIGYSAEEGQGLECSTGMKHWFDDFVGALTPSEALFKAYGDAVC
ncbi:hypothetical protein ACET9D_08605 [Aeromonas veronii]